ncbi:MAG: hypothetical protein ACREX8_10325 [Gammaproteobacteria bacterium]
MNAVRGRVFPASVVLPGGGRPWRQVAVVFADDGMHVYRAPAEVADWHARVDWSATTVPVGWAARGGYTVYLVGGGAVVVTPGGGCSCGPLGRWAGPSWATVERAQE